MRGGDGVGGGVRGRGGVVVIGAVGGGGVDVSKKASFYLLATRLSAESDTTDENDRPTWKGIIILTIHRFFGINFYLNLKSRVVTYSLKEQRERKKSSCIPSIIV
jgi:hypothetical protein